MAALPRWPAPSGSRADGPTGSSTTASSANSPSHPSRSFASAIAIDFLPMSRALPIAVASPVAQNPKNPQNPKEPERTRKNPDLHLHLGDDGVGETPQAVDLGGHGLGVGPHHVGPTEAHDDVGHALLLEAAHAVDAEGVHGD